MLHNWNGAGFLQGSYGSGFPWGSLLLWAFLLGLAALSLITLINSVKTRGRIERNGYDDASERGIDILVERFARGEIDAETFRTMKAELVDKQSKR